MVTPSYMKGKKPLKIPVHSVMDVLGAIGDLGHSGQFRQAAKQKGAFMTVHPDTVNFVKDYLAQNNLHTKSDVASQVVNACPGPDPNDCPYSQKD
jgi:hypothetical protein